MITSTGNGKIKDLVRLKKSAKERAKNGDHEAQYWLGICYEEGRGVRQDDTMAVAWLQAAEQENDRAQVALARHELNAGDRDSAERWLRKAAKRDNPTAKKRPSSRKRLFLDRPCDGARCRLKRLP